MALSTYSLVDGQVLDGNAITSIKSVATNVYFYTDKITGYVYWLAGSIFVNGVAYVLSAGNSGISQTNKLIKATLADVGNTASISFITVTERITSNSDFLLGYVDSSSRLYLYSSTAQPNLSGYTYTVATDNINVNGEGYFLSASAFAEKGVKISSSGGSGQGSYVYATTSLTVTIDGTVTKTETNTNNARPLGANDSYHTAVCSLTDYNALTKFNNNLTVSINAAVGISGSPYSQDNINSFVKKNIVYVIK
ncbi:MAG: hypothetical protein ACOYWZ_00085 [Bacillota bacterium]